MSGNKFVRTSEDAHEKVVSLKDSLGFESMAETVSFLASVSETLESEGEVEKILENGGIVTGTDSIDTADMLYSTSGEDWMLLRGFGKPRGGVTPLPKSRRTQGEVYCPACESSVLSYSLDDWVPHQQGGIFEEMDIVCSTCGVSRSERVLFVASPDLELPSGWSSESVHYWLYRLLTGVSEGSEFARKLEEFGDVEETAGREWLPSPDEWVGKNVAGSIDVTVERYAGLLESIIQVAGELTTDIEVSSVEMRSPDAGSGLEEWQFYVGFTSGDMAGLVSLLREYMSSWEETTIEQQGVDAVKGEAEAVDGVLVVSGLADLS